MTIEESQRAIWNYVVAKAIESGHLSCAPDLLATSCLPVAPQDFEAVGRRLLPDTRCAGFEGMIENTEMIDECVWCGDREDEHQ